MNITHNSCDKYIPNQLFRSTEIQQSEYDCQTRRLQGNQEESFTNGFMNKSVVQKSFHEKTSIINNFQSSKDAQKISSNPQQIKIEESYQSEEHNLKKEVVNLKKQTNKLDIKSKKKSSYKRKNLKKLFQEFEDTPGQNTNYKLSSNHTSFINSSDINTQKNIFDSVTNEEQHQNQKESKFKNQQQDCQEISQSNLGYLKGNKFNFLHNDFNLNSSSSDEQHVMKVSIKKSDSSQNDSQKVASELPKIESSKKMFIKSSDLDFQSSDQQETRENTESKQLKQEKVKCPINQQNLRNSFSSDSSSGNRNITVSEFRKEFTTLSEEYLKKSLPINTSMNLVIKRDKSKTKSDFVQYYIYDSNLLKQIAVVIKKSSTYQIYAKTNVENPRAHTDLKYLTAILEINFLGNEFKLKYVQHEFSQSKGLQDQIAASILYETNFLGFNGPRRMKVYIPKNSTVKYYGEKSLYELNQKMCSHRIDRYINREAKWNNEVKSYVLNLKGQAKLSSIKNFVIIRDSKQEQFRNKNFVIFGKMDKDIFNLSLCGPFSILQGVSIAISSFQRKITCQ